MCFLNLGTFKKHIKYCKNYLNINYLNIISQWNIYNYHIDIFDINGKLIYSNYFTNPRTTINTDLFSKGIYLMKISYTIDGEYKSILKKIIKK